MTDDLSAADLLYGVKAIAEYLGLPEASARHRIDKAIIPTFRMGGTICSRRATLRKWLADCEAAARAKGGSAPDAGR